MVSLSFSRVTIEFHKSAQFFDQLSDYNILEKALLVRRPVSFLKNKHIQITKLFSRYWTVLESEMNTEIF
jgi:hypothetical protein